jgi:hypothetical protein
VLSGIWSAGHAVGIVPVGCAKELAELGVSLSTILAVLLTGERRCQGQVAFTKHSDPSDHRNPFIGLWTFSDAPVASPTRFLSFHALGPRFTMFPRCGPPHRDGAPVLPREPGRELLELHPA